MLLIKVLQVESIKQLKFWIHKFQDQKQKILDR